MLTCQPHFKIGKGWDELAFFYYFYCINTIYYLWTPSKKKTVSFLKPQKTSCEKCNEVQRISVVSRSRWKDREKNYLLRIFAVQWMEYSLWQQSCLRRSRASQLFVSFEWVSKLNFNLEFYCYLEKGRVGTYKRRDYSMLRGFWNSELEYFIVYCIVLFYFTTNVGAIPSNLNGNT